jgi:membrane-associated phospholipid phosphatase
MPFDEDFQSWASKHHSAPSRGWAATSKAIGDGYFTLPAAGLLWAVGEWNEQPRLARASRNGLEAWCLTEFFVQSTKYGFHRWRPSESTSSQNWDGPGIGSKHLSFPSGHSASAWGLLPAYAMEYSDSWWVPTLAYALSASTSLSRIHDGEHWMSDVFLSAGVGVLTNRVVRRWNARQANAVAVVPLWGNGRRGVAFVSGF